MNLLDDLNNLRIPHYTCEDCYYSCPASGECCRDCCGTECDCNANDHNAIVDRVIKFLLDNGVIELEETHT